MKKIALMIAILTVMAILWGCTEPGATALESPPEATALAAPAGTSDSVQKSGAPEAETGTEQPLQTATAQPSSGALEISAQGVYQGQADNNFIEVKIDGQPEESATMVFMLSGEIKSNFDAMKLETGDAVKLKYFKNEAGQLVLTEFARLEIK